MKHGLDFCKSTSQVFPSYQKKKKNPMVFPWKYPWEILHGILAHRESNSHRENLLYYFLQGAVPLGISCVHFSHNIRSYQVVCLFDQAKALAVNEHATLPWWRWEQYTLSAVSSSQQAFMVSSRPYRCS